MNTLVTKPFPRLVATLAVMVAVVGTESAWAAAVAPAALDDGTRLFESGHYADAVTSFLAKAARCAAAHQTTDQVSALVDAAAAYQELGQYCSAADCLEKALILADTAGAPGLKMRVLAALGNVRLFARQTEPAERHLRDALALAGGVADQTARAGILQNLGSLLVTKDSRTEPAYQKDTRGFILSEEAPASADAAFAEGLGMYDEGLRLVKDCADRSVAVRILLNKGRALLGHGDGPPALAACRQAWDELTRDATSRDKAFLTVACGRLFADLMDALPAEAKALATQAFTAYTGAAELAGRTGDARTHAYALEYLAELYRRDGRADDALRLAQEAVRLAVAGNCEEARFQGEWLVGRGLRDQGKADEAIDAYRLAVRTLHGLRGDLSVGAATRGVRLSFRESVGQAYFELADLLLKRAERVDRDAAAVQADLMEARDTVEMLKSVEIQEYYCEDDCVSLQQSKTRALGPAVKGAVMFYIIPLPDRTELLLALPTGLCKVRSPASSRDIVEETRRFRKVLQDPASDQYREGARRLYDWLIKPAEPQLSAAGCETLVFIPDGALRTIPMAALHDGQQYLIQKYAISVVPGLSLMESRSLTAGNRRVLMCGVSKAVQGYPALPFVPAELDQVYARFGGVRLQDEAFQLTAFENALTRDQFSIVHIASHGQFGADASKTYILSYDGKITLDRLEQLILPHMLGARPIELLTLSACRTAAGDDRAALGLAGIAVKSGARSALATLWYVSDEAAQRLVADFYDNLKCQPGVSKAQALKSAQCTMLTGSQFGHPCFWAPYLLIGNWL